MGYAAICTHSFSIFLMEYHVPVMLNECMEGLNIEPNGVYVDVTFGGGGHSREILSHLNEDGLLIGFDQDADAKNNVPDDDRFVFVNHNFRWIRNFLKYYGVEQVEGILADLGVSSHHFDTAERGFSFRFDAELDMRMDKESDFSAVHMLNSYEESRLADVFYYYGELKNARQLASKIVEVRKNTKIETIAQLKQIADDCFKRGKEHKYLAQIFQAIRIEVNQELEVLKDLLEASIDVLAEGGRLVIMTYHSLEDRLVKNFLKTGNFEGKIEKDFYGNVISPFKLINKKVIVASKEEQNKNSRSTSAKLRIAERVKSNG